jgi:hypothetical protein
MDKIIIKIKKLLALSEDKANLHEAMAAASQAQNLITKYNITECMLKEDDQGELINFVTEGLPLDVFRELKREDKIPIWKACLSTVVADINGCATYVSHISLGDEIIKVLGLIGRMNDGIVTKQLYSYLVNEIELLSISFENTKEWNDSFKYGASKMIAERLKETQEKTRNDLEKEYSHSNEDIGKFSEALILFDSKQSDAKKYLENILGATEQGKVEFRLNLQAEHMGRSEAKKIDLEFNRKLKPHNVNYLK